MLKKIFIENLHWKLIALVFSVTMWLIVSTSTTPVEVPREVAVELKDLPADLIRISDLVNKIDIRISGPISVVNNIKSEDLSYKINLANAVPELNTYSVLGSGIQGLPGSVKVSSISPSQITIMFDERVEKDNVPVSIETKGAPRIGFEIGEMTVLPPLVTIGGAKYQVEQTTSVPTEVIDLAGRDQTFTVNAGLNVIGTYVDVPGQSEVAVKIEVRPIITTRRFDKVPIRVVNTTLAFAVTPATVSFDVMGTMLAVESIAPEDLKVFVDAEGLGPGEHKLQTRIETPADTQAAMTDLPLVLVVLANPPPPIVEGKKKPIGSGAAGPTKEKNN